MGVVNSMGLSGVTDPQHTVCLVLDENFGPKLRAIAEVLPVWIIESAANDPIVRQMRSEKQSYALTRLLRVGPESCIDTLGRAILAIDEHHGPDSSDDPYRHILVIGSGNNLIPGEVASLLGLGQFQWLPALDPSAFIASKSDP